MAQHYGKVGGRVIDRRDLGWSAEAADEMPFFITDLDAAGFVIQTLKDRKLYRVDYQPDSEEVFKVSELTADSEE
jgi:hypothetical protein